jgi:hypothetical protein
MDFDALAGKLESSPHMKEQRKTESALRAVISQLAANSARIMHIDIAAISQWRMAYTKRSVESTERLTTRRK